MDRITFEQTAKPGDLVFIISNVEGIGWVGDRRRIQSGIYERSINVEYGKLRHHGQFIPSEKEWDKHGFDFYPHLHDFPYSEVNGVVVAMGREDIAKNIGAFLGEVAQQDFKARFDGEFKY